MILIATHDCQLDGCIYRVGDSVDYDGVVTRRIAYNFNDENGHPLVIDGDAERVVEVKKPERDKASERLDGLLKTFTREQLMAKLDECGASYKAQSKTESLARLYLRTMGEID